MKKINFLLAIICWLTLLACQQSKESLSSNGQGINQEVQDVKKNGAVEIDGFNLNYIRKGNGEPIFVVGSSEYYSKAFSEDLPQHFELIFVDSRHFVADCNPAEEELANINLSTFSSDLESIRAYLGLEKVGLIGHSIHGQIALEYAVNYPDHLSKLIIIGGIPYVGGDLESHKEKIWNTLASEQRKSILATNSELLKTALESTDPDEMFAVTYHHEAPLYWMDPNYDASGLLNGLRTCPAAFGKLAGNLPSKTEASNKLNRLSVPTLVILGKQDFAIPYTAWETMIKDNQAIDYLLMENASHNPHTEETSQAAFDKHLLKWVSDLN